MATPLNDNADISLLYIQGEEEEEEERHESEAGKDDQLNMPKLLNPVLSENSSSAEW